MSCHLYTWDFQEALEETKEAFENASLGIEGPPGLLEEGVRQLGDSTRKKFEQMISHIIDDDDKKGENLLLLLISQHFELE